MQIRKGIQNVENEVVWGSYGLPNFTENIAIQERIRVPISVP